VAVVTIHVIMYMIKELVKIGGITTVIVVITPVLGLTVTTLLLDVGSGLMDQTGHHNLHDLAEINSNRNLRNLGAGKINILQAHAGVGMRRKKMTEMNISAAALCTEADQSIWGRFKGYLPNI